MRQKPAHKGIDCPECGSPTETLYTRPRGAVTYRRRRCPCGFRFTTAEKIVNRGAASPLTDRTALALSITDLLRSAGLTPADLQTTPNVSTGDRQ